MPTRISERRLAANRANASKSTGPRTPRGKARASGNARKHGFTAATFAVVRLEDLEEVARLREDLIPDYRPVNAQELFAIERLALAQQSLLRVARLEAGLFTAGMNDTLDPLNDPVNLMNPEMAGNGDVEITRAQNRNLLLALGFRKTADRSNAWGLFLRYQVQAERNYRRAVEDFERLKSKRDDLPNEPIIPAQPEENTQEPEPQREGRNGPEEARASLGSSWHVQHPEIDGSIPVSRDITPSGSPPPQPCTAPGPR
jgi:hypothetical protein